MPETRLLRQIRHFADERSQVAIHRLSPQTDMSWHRHEFLEIVFILSGRGVHVTGNTRHDIGAGDVLVINSRRTHAYEETQDLELVNVLVREDLLREAEKELGMLPGFHALFTLEAVRWRLREYTNRLRLNRQDLRMVVEWIDAIENEIQLLENGGRFLGKCWLLLLVGLLSRRYEEIEENSPEVDMRLGRLLSRIEQSPEEAFSLGGMAREAGMSERSFQRHFREATGYSPAEYVIRARIRRATALLLRGADGESSITEVAFACGFNDSNYFARQFRRITGRSPREYRKTYYLASPVKSCTATLSR